VLQLNMLVGRCVPRTRACPLDLLCGIGPDGDDCASASVAGRVR